ncbi:MAG: ParB-like nuclease domain-containing protein [Solobacterium sp.]|nr:ParB-like nuclease domain-containing protein [Solobacterium sp.]
MSIYGQYDLRGILGDQTGEDFIEKKKTTKVFLAEIEEVKPNPNNKFSTDSEGIDLLASNIEENGLLHDLVAYRCGDKYVLISGHRRLLALQKLMTCKKNYVYHGLDITGRVPLTVIDNPKNEDAIGLLIISANHQRNLSAQEKREVIRYTLSCLKSLEKENKYTWPVGVRTCKVLAEKTGIAEHFIKDFLAETGLSKDREEQNCRSHEMSKEEKVMKGFKKAIRTLKKQASDFDLDILSQLDSGEIADIKTQLQELICQLQTFIE